MVKRRLKKEVLYVIYGLIVVSLMFTVQLVRKTFKTEEKEEIKYVDKIIIDDDTIPVINSNLDTIIRPYLDNNINIVLNYYDKNSESIDQEKALIYYESTYIPSTGIAYSNDRNFDVVSILNGVVIDIEESTTLGKIIKIDHGNNLISIYQSLDEVKVNIDDYVDTGTVIATAGTSTILSSLGKHLYFELIHNGTTVNPELYYDKNLNEI